RNARVTGLRLEGPSHDDGWGCTWNPTHMQYDCHLKAPARGIEVADEVWPIVDQNEISDFTEAAVTVSSYGAVDVETDYSCVEGGLPGRARTARVFRNFLHHNMRDGLGYGVETGENAFAFV